MKRPKPTDLHSVDLKVWRAETHLKALQRQAAAIEEAGLPRFRMEVEGEGLKHAFYPVGLVAVPDSFLVTLGDCIHNLRTVLDHVACNLVRISGSEPDQIYFPVLHSPFRTNRCTGALEPSLQLPVSAEIRDWLDSVQPYQRTETGRRLGILHDLDIVDKHRGMIVSAFAADAVRKTMTRENWADASKVPFPNSFWFSDEPLNEGRKCATVTYETPQFEVDPHVKIRVKIRFEGRGPASGEAVLTVLDDLMRLVVEELLPSAGSFFGIDPAAPRTRVLQVWRLPHLPSTNDRTAP